MLSVRKCATEEIAVALDLGGVQPSPSSFEVVFVVRFHPQEKKHQDFWNFPHILKVARSFTTVEKHKCIFACICLHFKHHFNSYNFFAHLQCGGSWPRRRGIFLMCDSASAAWLLRQLDPNRPMFDAKKAVDFGFQRWELIQRLYEYVWIIFVFFLDACFLKEKIKHWCFGCFFSSTCGILRLYILWKTKRDDKISQFWQPDVS